MNLHITILSMARQISARQSNVLLALDCKNHSCRVYHLRSWWYLAQCCKQYAWDWRQQQLDFFINGLDFRIALQSNEWSTIKILPQWPCPARFDVIKLFNIPVLL